MGWLTINLGHVNAHGLPGGHPNENPCDATSKCDPYVKLFIDDKVILETPPKDETEHFNVDFQYVSEKIKKSSTITIEIWDKDGTIIFDNDQLILKRMDNINSFLNEPFCGGEFFSSKEFTNFMYQNSINTYSFWEDEYEN